MTTLSQKLLNSCSSLLAPTRSRRAYRSILALPLLFLAGPLLVLALAVGASVAFHTLTRTDNKQVEAPLAITPAPRENATTATLRAANAALLKKLQGLSPVGQYLLIDTAGNRVFLRRGDKTEAEMIASCGSGNTLEDPKGGRSWVFDTPRGQFSIKSKLTDPLWMKPDWAFIEEGEEIPTDPAERAAPGMMGDYALGIGQGYFIHGTLYTRLLGRNVSHGCVRLGEQDLARLYRTMPLGAKVIIF